MRMKDLVSIKKCLIRVECTCRICVCIIVEIVKFEPIRYWVESIGKLKEIWISEGKKSREPRFTGEKGEENSALSSCLPGAWARSSWSVSA